MEINEEKIAGRLVREVSQGHRHAETELVQRYSRGLLLLLRRRCQDTMLAEDLHQECIAVVLTRLRSGPLKEPAKLARFINRTASNLVIAHIRKRERQRTHCDADGIERIAGAFVDPAEALNREQIASVTRQMLSELSIERDREVLTRFYLDQQEKSRICADFDISDEHLNRILFRARRRFRSLLERSESRHHLRVVS